jgi:hypothetical protein
VDVAAHPAKQNRSFSYDLDNSFAYYPSMLIVKIYRGSMLRAPTEKILTSNP